MCTCYFINIYPLFGNFKLKKYNLLEVSHTLYPERLGPLIRSWCMRYEAKHHNFKRMAVLIDNFIKLPFSLAKKNQEGLCDRFQSNEGSSFIETLIEVGPGRVYLMLFNGIVIITAPLVAHFQRLDLNTNRKWSIFNNNKCLIRWVTDKHVTNCQITYFLFYFKLFTRCSFLCCRCGLSWPYIIGDCWNWLSNSIVWVSHCHP